MHMLAAMQRSTPKRTPSAARSFDAFQMKTGVEVSVVDVLDELKNWSPEQILSDAASCGLREDKIVTAFDNVYHTNLIDPTIWNILRVVGNFYLERKMIEKKAKMSYN